MAKDPVCGMEVKEQEAAGKKDYQGTTYYFCSQECRDQFTTNPQQYAGQPDTDEEKTGGQGQERPRKTA